MSLGWSSIISNSGTKCNISRTTVYSGITVTIVITISSTSDKVKYMEIQRFNVFLLYSNIIHQS